MNQHPPRNSIWPNIVLGVLILAVGAIMITTAVTRKAAMISPLEEIENSGRLEIRQNTELFIFRKNGDFGYFDGSISKNTNGNSRSGFWKNEGANRFVVTVVAIPLGLHNENDLRYYRYTYYIADFVKGSRTAPIISLEEKVQIPKQDDLFQKVMGKR